MAQSSPLILVFWHDHFDEIAAAIFVAELRGVGQKVRLVGLGASKNRGKHGLRLVPDTTISEALVLQDEVSMVVLPCDVWSESMATHDPRLRELLFTLSHHHTRLLVGGSAVSTLGDWLPPTAEPFLEAYPPIEALVPFVRGIALSL
jgi:hypothetical protein